MSAYTGVVGCIATGVFLNHLYISPEHVFRVPARFWTLLQHYHYYHRPYEFRVSCESFAKHVVSAKTRVDPGQRGSQR